MLHFLQANMGTIVAMLVVALLVFLAIRRLVLDKKAGIGPCGQKCSECAHSAQCEMQKDEEPTACSGVCEGCKYASQCHKN